MVDAYITSVIYYRLTVVTYPDAIITKQERILFLFLWIRNVSIVRRSVSCRYPINGGLIIPWFMMRIHPLRLAINRCGQSFLQ